MRGFNLGSIGRQQKSQEYRKIFDREDIKTGNILANRRFFTNKVACPMCKPKLYLYGDTKRERQQKLEQHLKDKHS